MGHLYFNLYICWSGLLFLIVWKSQNKLIYVAGFLPSTWNFGPICKRRKKELVTRKKIQLFQSINAYCVSCMSSLLGGYNTRPPGNEKQRTSASHTGLEIEPCHIPIQPLALYEIIGARKRYTFLYSTLLSCMKTNVRIINFVLTHPQ